FLSPGSCPLSPVQASSYDNPGTSAPAPTRPRSPVSREPLVATLLAGLLCLAPLAVYLLWVPALARPARPPLASGTWDFVGLVAGLSGFILFGGGVVLYLLRDGFRYWMRGNLESFRQAWGNEKYMWMLLSAIYLFAVVGTIALALASRRRSLTVYN